MTDEKKQELFPYFAYIYSKEINPDKYGNMSSEEWSAEIQNSPEDIEKITQAAQNFTDEEWDSLEEYISSSQNESNLQYAAKGAKLKKLKSVKKKCACGCDMVSVKEGGKLSSVCSCKCGGKMKPKKHEKGGYIQRLQKGKSIKEITDNTITAPGKLIKGMQRKVHIRLPWLQDLLTPKYGNPIDINQPTNTVGKIYNPAIGQWVEGTQDVLYNTRAANYENQPTATRMNQTRVYGQPTNGKWDQTFRNDHRNWNNATDATAEHQQMLNASGGQYGLSITNKWDNATRQADKNYQTEMLKTPIIQENDNTRVSTRNTLKPANTNTDAKNWLEKRQPTQPTQQTTTQPKSQGLVKSNEVLDIQNKLNQFGAGLVEDGLLGNKTKTAIKKIQSELGLKADGIYGPKTKAAIENALKAKETQNIRSQNNDNAPFIEKLQGFKKGGKMYQSGGSAVSAQSQVGVAKKGTTLPEVNVSAKKIEKVKVESKPKKDYEAGKDNSGGKMKKQRITKGQSGLKTKYDPKKPYSKTNFSGGAYNKYLEGMNKSSIDSLQQYNRANSDESDQRPAKKLLKDLRSGKSKMPKNDKDKK